MFPIHNKIENKIDEINNSKSCKIYDYIQLVWYICTSMS